MTTRPTAAPNSNGGFSLIEVLVALAIISIVFLGLADTSLVALDFGRNNQLREEAVGIADNVTESLRNTTWATLLATPATALHFPRVIRGKNIDYEVVRTIAPIDGNNTQVTVRVQWDASRYLKGRWVPDRRTHQITTVVSSGTGLR